MVIVLQVVCVLMRVRPEAAHTAPAVGQLAAVSRESPPARDADGSKAVAGNYPLRQGTEDS